VRLALLPRDTSCAKVCFYLTHCGLTWLDGDGDRVLWPAPPMPRCSAWRWSALVRCILHGMALRRPGRRDARALDLRLCQCDRRRSAAPDRPRPAGKPGRGRYPCVVSRLLPGPTGWGAQCRPHRYGSCRRVALGGCWPAGS